MSFSPSFPYSELVLHIGGSLFIISLGAANIYIFLLVPETRLLGVDRHLCCRSRVEINGAVEDYVAFGAVDIESCRVFLVLKEASDSEHEHYQHVTIMAS